MMNNNNTLCIAEWQSFGVNNIKAVIADKSEAKAKNIFKELKDFANQKGNFDDRKGNHIFLTPYRNNQLQARNYVGLIQTKSGFCLEILPKTFRADKFDNSVKCNGNKDCKCPICEAKDILLKMLQTLRDSPFKQSHISNLKTHKFPLLEIFANMFLDELECLIKRGIKSDYVAVEDNRTFLKGKLLFTQNLRHNLTHKERFYTASDEFIADIAPNRLIVSTLLLLSKCNFSGKTSGRILQSRFVFDEIAPSQNYDKDFAKCENLRHFKSYEMLLLWCKIFLKRHNFMPYQGDKKAFALLFKMQKLFENFVAWHLQRALTNHTIKAQDKSKHLIKGDKFNIKPDLVIYHNAKLENPPKIIADTKWKILDFSKDDCGISQGDLYQIFAYLAKYECENGLLIFPKIDGESAPQTFIYKAKSNLGEAKCHKLQIHFFDCQNPSEILRILRVF